MFLWKLLVALDIWLPGKFWSGDYRLGCASAGGGGPAMRLNRAFLQ